jgi:hypothetical protein
MSSKPVMITLGLNYDGTKRGLADVRQQMRQLDAATKEMGHGTVSSMQASSAAIRVFEGGITNSIRAAERFIGTIPGVSAALQAIFPAIGAAAIGGVFIKVGEEVANFVKKMNTIPPNPFQEMIASGKIANDQLAIGNDRLAMEIAKLEHKPVNGMALALDQARESSDKLFDSIRKTTEAFNEAMSKDSIGRFKGVWNNLAPTDAASKDITSARSGVTAVTADHQATIDDALASGNMGNVSQAREAMMVDLQKAYGQEVKQLKAGLAAALAKQKDFQGSYHVGSDQSKNIEMYQAAIAQAATEQGAIGGNYGQSVMQPKKDSLDAAKANAGDSQQAKLLKQMEEGLEKQKAMYGVSVADTLAYWSARISAFTQGSDQLHAVQMNQYRLQAELYTQMQEGKKKYLEYSGKATEGNDLLGEGQQKLITEPATAQDKRNNESRKQYNEAVAKGAQEQEKAATAFAAAGIQIAVMQGAMTGLNAAVAMGALHQRDYAAELQLVNLQREEQIRLINDTPDADMSAQDKSNAIRNINKSSKDQTSVLDGTYAVTQRQDAAAVYANTTAGVITTGFNQIVNTWTNAGQQVVSLFEASINTINGTLVNVMTSRNRAHQIPREFEAMGHSIFTDATGKSLQAGEGLIGSALGFGGKKADGSAASPFHVIMAGFSSAAGAVGGATSGISGIAGRAAGLLGGLFSGGGSAAMKTLAGAKDTSGNMGLLESLGTSMLPMLAGGGDVLAGHPAMIGERGPELFVPHTSGRVVPNGSFGTSHNISIDARGSSDPAATEAAVHRAMSQYLPAAVGASVGAVKEQGRRVPLSHR